MSDHEDDHDHMHNVETRSEKKKTSTDTGGRVDTGFIKKPSGYLMLINLVSCIVTV